MRYGEDALAALETVVADALAHHPLGPVTVVTPSPVVAVTTRRALARRLGGMVGVGFHSIGALAEMIAAPQLAGVGAGVDREVVVAGVRTVLAAEPGRLEPIRHHRSTWESVAATITELDALRPDERARVVEGGELSSEMARLYEAVMARVGSIGQAEVFRLAVEAVSSGTARLDEVGPVVVHLPGRLGRTEVDLLESLAAHVPITLVLGTAGRSVDDADLARSMQRLGVSPPATPVDPPVATSVVSANDVDDEVRAVVRRLLRLADRGTPLHRMALVHPRGAPYSRVVADVLASADVPFSAPSTQTLAQSAAGRVLSGLLSVIRSGYARQDVVDLWATGTVLDGDGRLAPAASFDDLSRRLGVIRGIERWRSALEVSDTRITARAADDDEDESNLQSWKDDRLAANDRLRRSLALIESVAADAPTQWSDVADWVSRAIDTLCGTSTSRSSWPEYEIEADTAIRTALGRLVALHAVEPDPARSIVFDTIETVLGAPAPRRTRTGRGLLVTTIDRPPVVPLDAVAVVGLVEGQAPHVAADDVLLGEALRSSLGLPGADDRQRDERRGFDAAMASAGSVRLLSFARHDQRSGRTMVPSRWLVDAVERVSGVRPEAEKLMEGADVAGVEIVPSYSAGLAAVDAGNVAALHAEEKTFASLASAGSPDGHPALADPIISRGTMLVRSRAAIGFSRFDGNLGGDGVDVSSMAVLSPTSLETYASCPRRWFFAHALRLRTTDRPEEVDRLQAREKGTLAHLVLERFFAEMIDRQAVPVPGAPWSVDALERLLSIAAEECDALEGRGLTGHPLWWEHDKAEIHTALLRALERDVEVRAELGTMPVAVEFGFGRNGAAPLEVDLGDGRKIALAGSADRVDVGEGVVKIWDYKYSGSRAFDDLIKPEDKGGDPLLGGTKLQLVAYGMAASAEHPGLETHAAYWFLRPDAEKPTAGYVVDDALRDRFRRVLGVLAGGIGEGRFPARPGEYRWHLGTHAHCAWCDFDDICPRDRDEEWERVRFHPSLRGVARLADEGSASVLTPDPAPGAGAEVRS